MLAVRKVPLLLLLMLPAHPSLSEIYRWQDEQGKWHFSDAPKSSRGKPAVIRGAHATADDAGERQVQAGEDLEARLIDRFRPSSTVEHVTIAVVGIETHLGEGSGFFVSEQGHIVTNRHVIRPSTTGAWKMSEQQFEEGRQRLQSFQEKLDHEKRALDDYAEKLKRYRRDIEAKSEGSAKNTALAEYEGFEARYQQRRSHYLEQQKAQEERMREFEGQYSEFTLKGSMAGAARQFKIVLKDNTELRARLLKISKKHDLALLKLDGYRTPALSLATQADLRQGREVFAVGSPLGMKDAVTSGIITSLKKDYLVTDAQIMPGNSGGPLLDLENGQVLGVNTLKFAQNVLADGFGFAIPAAVLAQEFGGVLNQAK